MFNNLITKINEALKTGNVVVARSLLDEAWKVADSEADRKTAHNIGNKVQREIFAQYELGTLQQAA